MKRHNPTYKAAGGILPFLLAIMLSFLGTDSFGTNNVLFIAVDDLRPELNCYGATHMVTPNIDRLAQAGRVFRRHYVSVPTCGASRYSLMTGKRPTTSLDTQNSAFNQLLGSEGSIPESFPHLFRRNGWRTISMGKVSHQPDGFAWNTSSALGGDDRGRTSVAKAEMPFSWDEIVFGHGRWGARVNPLFNYAAGTGRTARVSPAYEIGTNAVDETYLDGQIARAAVEKLRELKQDGSRFLLAVGFFRPHLPFAAPKEYYNRYDPQDLPAPSPASAPSGALSRTAPQSGEPDSYNHGYYPGDPGTDEDDAYRRRLRWAYYASVSYVDAQIGKVLDALDALDLAKNTIVVLWGDNGWCLDDYNLLGKHIVLERGVHCPLIIRTPQMPFPGRPTEGIVESIDIYPTLARLCGLTPPGTIGGTSLIPMLNNPDAPGKGWAYCRQIGHLDEDSIRTDRWRLIRIGSEYDLFDLASFPYELQDVSANNPTVVNDLVSTKLNVQSTRPGTTNYNAWRTNAFTPTDAANEAISGPGADPDADGTPNLLECLGSTRPKDAGDFNQVTGQVSDLSAFGLGTNTFSVRVTASALVDDVAFEVQESVDLSSWSPAVQYLTNQSVAPGLFNYIFADTNSIDARPRSYFRIIARQTR
jgi:arylsulfatase A-like enzyme